MRPAQLQDYLSGPRRGQTPKWDWPTVAANAGTAYCFEAGVDFPIGKEKLVRRSAREWGKLRGYVAKTSYNPDRRLLFVTFTNTGSGYYDGLDKWEVGLVTQTWVKCKKSERFRAETFARAIDRRVIFSGERCRFVTPGATGGR